MDAQLAIGIDLGGTNLKAALVDRGATVLAQAARTSDAARGPRAVVAEMVELGRELLRSSGQSLDAVVGVGIGSPGPLSARRGVIHQCANLPGWKSVPLRDMARDAFDRPAVLENDANAAAYGEYWLRRQAGIHQAPTTAGADMVLLTLGTGVGAGAILGGRVFSGHHENAAELGHWIVVPDGLPCPCGQRGCLEQYCSAGAVGRMARSAVQRREPSTLQSVIDSGREITAADVASHARSGDPVALRVWNDACRFLAIACINTQHAYNPALVVMAGGMIQAGEFLLDRVRASMNELRWSLAEDLPALEFSRFGPDVGAVGAAGLVFIE